VAQAEQVRLKPTGRAYLCDESLQIDATVVAVHGNALACTATRFYPGGGGQPADLGSIRFENVGAEFGVESVWADEAGVIWHACAASLSDHLIGKTVCLSVDPQRRNALSRHHTALHLLNAVALKDYGGWITGAQIATDYARIDFKIEDFSATLCAELERKVNDVLEQDYPTRSYFVTEDEFARRGDLLRTLEVRPPVVDGMVRVVEIVGFDAQACGGTHARSTRELGCLSIYRTENKGRINKRLYIRLEPGP
jgi:misacylated tRNA(Ala) deacylase